MNIIRTYRKVGAVVAVVAVSASLIAACGASKDNEKLQQQGVEIQKQAQQAREDVASGKKTADEVSAELEKSAAEIQKKAGETADTAIEQAKDQPGVTDEMKKQLEAAQAQIDGAQK